MSHAVVVRIAQRLARAIPGVGFAPARVEPHDPPLADRVDLSIRLVVTLGPSLHRLADAVRETVRRHAPRLTGARVDRVDITIDDTTISSSKSSSRSPNTPNARARDA